MIRRTARQTAAAGIQLFPFLAVLICTMGSLVVVLVAMARHGQMQAMANAAALQRTGDEDTKAERESIEWEIPLLQESRQKTQAQLEEGRLELSHVEDHLRRLREKADELRGAIDHFQRAASGSLDQTNAERELAEVNWQIAEARAWLASRPSNQDQASYSIVPYHGPNQTRRRPIYIECRGDAVVLQPEGVRLLDSDFSGTLTAGNPLAAAMRAQREYLKKSGLGGDGEPYPLLIVRPDGIPAYYAARAALSSWDADFGYELVDADWELTYQPPDAQLAEHLEQVVEEARIRQRMLARAAPRSYKKTAKRGFHAGFENDGGASSGQPGFDDWSPLSSGANRMKSEPPAKQVPGDAQAGGSKPAASAQEAGGQQSGDDQRPHAESLSKKRGTNWGLPDAGRSAVPMTRPIVIECYRDRLVIVPDRASGEPKQVPFGAATEDSIDDLVSKVWQHMKGWGIAGKNLYWRPTLVMKVAPDATGRYAELKQLLEDSGLDVKQKGESTARVPDKPLRGTAN